MVCLAGGCTNLNSLPSSRNGLCNPRRYNICRHPTVARMKWRERMNKIFMECYLSFKPVKENDAPFREYRKRAWQDIEPVETTRQRGSDYVGGIRKMFASCGK